MPTVRKTTPGTVTIHDTGTFSKDTTREVSKDTADYLVEERGGFERVHDGGTEAFPDEEDAQDVEFEESSQDASGGEICGVEKANGETCERPADDCPYHGDGDSE
jgi:hypothetical protein